MARAVAGNAQAADAIAAELKNQSVQFVKREAGWMIVIELVGADNEGGRARIHVLSDTVKVTTTGFNPEFRAVNFRQGKNGFNIKGIVAKAVEYKQGLDEKIRQLRESIKTQNESDEIMAREIGDLPDDLYVKRHVGTGTYYIQGVQLSGMTPDQVKEFAAFYQRSVQS